MLIAVHLLESTIIGYPMLKVDVMQHQSMMSM